MENPRRQFSLIFLHVVAVVLCVALAGICEGSGNNTTPAPITHPNHTEAGTTKPPTQGPTNASSTTPQAPTKAPGPIIGPSVGNWTIHGPNNTVCMRVSFALQLNITYTTKDKKDAVKVINMSPDVANLISDCRSVNSNRTLTIYPFGTVEVQWTVSLTFSKDSEYYKLTTVEASWNYSHHLPDSKETGYVIQHKTQGNFLPQRVKLGNYYTCTTPLTVGIGEANVRFSDIELQPFAEKSNGKLGNAEVCVFGLSWKYIVIIAVVGGALLIAVIALIACLVCKRKKKYTAFQNE